MRFICKQSAKPLLILFCAITFNGLYAQKKVLGLPDLFNQPVDYLDLGKQKRFVESERPKSTETPWMVISDREDNPVYDAPNGNAIHSIGFRQSFYVVEEKGAWVKLIEGRVDGLKVVSTNPVGWVEKKNLLCWTKGLSSLKSLISKKVLLLNKAGEIELLMKDRLAGKDKNIVDVFSGPNTVSTQEALKIFDPYFVLKRDLEHNKLLISRDAIISEFNMESIIGWVDGRKCVDWNNRVCLEPNFEEAAFQERAADTARFALRAFTDLASAEDFAKGNGKPRNVYWSDEPVKVDPNLLVDRRLPGSVLRMPMIDLVQSAGEQYFETGVVGSILVLKREGEGIEFIPEVEYDKLMENANKVEKASDNLNIFFTIEGTDCTYAYRQQIITAIQNISNTITKGIASVKFGVLVYRDIPEESVLINGLKTDRLVEMQELTSNVQQVLDFLEKVDYSNKLDRDEWTAMYYGISESLKNAGFQKDQTNVMVIMGCSGDFKVDSKKGGRREMAVKDGHKALFMSNEILLNSLGEFNIHLYAVQLRNDGITASKSYAAISQVLMLEAAKNDFNKYCGNDRDPLTAEFLRFIQQDYQLDVVAPTMDDYDAGDNIPLVNSRLPGRLVRPPEGKQIPVLKLEPILNGFVAESIENITGLELIVSSLHGDAGQSVQQVLRETPPEFEGDIGRLQPAILQYLLQQYKSVDITQELVKVSFEEKYKLFVDVFIPKKIEGARYPTVSFSVFMPAEELYHYQQTISRLLVGGSYSDKRAKLFEVHKDLVAQFAGEDETRKKNPETFTRKELASLLYGLRSEGLQEDWLLGGIRPHDFIDEKKVSNSEIDELILHYKKVHENISTTLRMGKNYKFCFRCDDLNQYYWIPVKELF